METLRVCTDYQKDTAKVFDWLVNELKLDVDMQMNKKSVTIYCKDRKELIDVFRKLTAEPIVEVAEIMM